MRSRCRLLALFAVLGTTSSVEAQWMYRAPHGYRGSAFAPAVVGPAAMIAPSRPLTFRTGSVPLGYSSGPQASMAPGGVRYVEMTFLDPNTLRTYTRAVPIVDPAAKAGQPEKSVAPPPAAATAPTENAQAIDAAIEYWQTRNEPAGVVFERTEKTQAGVLGFTFVSERRTGLYRAAPTTPVAPARRPDPPKIASLNDAYKADLLNLTSADIDVRAKARLGLIKALDDAKRAIVEETHKRKRNVEQELNAAVAQHQTLLHNTCRAVAKHLQDIYAKTPEALDNSARQQVEAAVNQIASELKALQP